MNESVLIIGGGLGGLFTGALLAKNGRHVTVLEKNATIGGGLQTFVRNGIRFETGMHMLGGFRKGGSLFRICHYLGILDRLWIRPTDPLCMDSLHYLDEGEHYEIPGGREPFTEYFARLFPHEADGIRRYVDALYGLSEEVGLFYLREDNASIFAHSEEFLRPADEFIARFVGDSRLRDILAYMNPMYGGVAHHTPAYIHALVNVLYINGEDRFEEGSSQLADALAGVIREAGGEVLSRARVEAIDCRERSIRCVSTSDGRQFSADRYIAAIHPCTLLGLLPDDALPRAYRNRLNEIPNSYSAFTLYLKLRPECFPYINHTCYCQKAHGMVWEFGRWDEEWPRGLMYMTPPEHNQGRYSRRMIITTPMSFEAVRRWEKTSTGRRGAEYEAWKREMAERILDCMERIHPGFRSVIEACTTSSPLTIRNYYGVKQGSMYGFCKDACQIALSQVPIVTKIRNLLLTGQNINLHGICGVPLTAINTAEVIVGQNQLIRAINNQYTKDYENR